MMIAPDTQFALAPVDTTPPPPAIDTNTTGTTLSAPGGAVDTTPWIPERTYTFAPATTTSPPPTNTPSSPAGPSSGPTTGTSTPDAPSPVSAFTDALQALTGLFGSIGGSVRQPQQPQGVAVPIQNTGNGGSGINWGVILLVAIIGGGVWFAYKRGWFSKAKKAATGE